MVKLLISSKGGKTIFTEEELKWQLTTILNTCSCHYNGEQATSKMKDKTLDDYLSGFNKPFPYHELFKLTLKVLSEYGRRIEQYFLTYSTSEKNIKNSLVQSSEITQGSGSKNLVLGRLTTRIEARADTLQKIQLAN